MKPRPDSSRRLRARAERIAKSRPPASAPSTKAEIIEELRIHQVELELQVEELRRTEQELQKTRDRFVALYEEAPVGYLTLDGSNFITRVNRAAVDLLGSSRSARASRPFTAHLDNTSRSTFYAVAAEVRQSFDRRSFDALLALAGRKPVWVELTLAAEPPGPELRVTMVDVTRQKNAERQLRELAERLISVQEIERASVASALHDDSGQQLTYLCILLEQAREGAAPAVVARMDEALEVARKVLEEIRRLSTSLSPAEIGRVGLLRAVQSMVNEFSTRTRIPVVFQPLGSTDGLPKPLALAAYRITQEALTNAARYAEPNQVIVSVQYDKSKGLQVEVRDDGRGFDTANVPMSLGLLSMRERARGVGGSVVVVSAPGHGTRVVFEGGGKHRAGNAVGISRPRDPAPKDRGKKDSPPVDGNPRG